MTTRNRLKLLNIEIDRVDFEGALGMIERSQVTVTPNVDHLWNLQRNRQFYDVYSRADLVLCDSRVLSTLLRLFGVRVEAMPGSEVFPAACTRLARRGASASVFLLGGTTAEHARLAAERLTATTGVRVAAAFSPAFGFEAVPGEIEAIADKIRSSGAHLVGVGLGSPKQELLISRLIGLLPGVRFMGIGATIDFESGLVCRAPKLMSALRLEWLFRFLREPRRLFARYFIYGPLVFYLLAKQGLGIYEDPFNCGAGRSKT